MRRALLLVLALGLVSVLSPFAHAQPDDPFADDNSTSSSNQTDPFSTYEQHRNETYQAKQNATLNSTNEAGAKTGATPTSATVTTTPAASPKAATPGFESAIALVAVGAALVATRRR
jgi:cytoskeletal protein RodZ